jgi:hypothetical protein
MPIGRLTDLSTSWRVVEVGFKVPKFILEEIESGMIETLAPRSHKALLMVMFPIEHGIEKEPGSSILGVL